jgi:hypothetical protein
MQQMIFIADLIACSTCFGHHCAHHQELESIIQVVAACGISCFGFQVVGMVWGSQTGHITLVLTMMHGQNLIKFLYTLFTAMFQIRILEQMKEFGVRHI